MRSKVVSFVVKPHSKTRYLVTLPIDEMKGAQTIAVDFAIAIGGSALGKAVGVGVALSAFGALNGSLFGASRLVHAMGNSGTLPSLFGSEAIMFGRRTPIAGIVSQVGTSKPISLRYRKA